MGKQRYFTGYKFLTIDSTGGFSSWRWSGYLPTPATRDVPAGIPGKWTPSIEGPLCLCENGYHLCYWDTLWEGYEQPYLYLAEAIPEKGILDGDDKACARKVRLVRWVPGWERRAVYQWAFGLAADYHRRIGALGPLPQRWEFPDSDLMTPRNLPPTPPPAEILVRFEAALRSAMGAGDFQSRPWYELANDLSRLYPSDRYDGAVVGSLLRDLVFVLMRILDSNWYHIPRRIASTLYYLDSRLDNFRGWSGPAYVDYPESTSVSQILISKGLLSQIGVEKGEDVHIPEVPF